MNLMMEMTIGLIRRLGYDVYRRNPNDSWAHFTDGTNIGYIQYGRFGFDFSTIHKPNTTTGTGFSIAKDLPETILTDNAGFEKLLKECFAFAPYWASVNDLRSVKKYKNIDEFLNYNSFNSQYVKVE